MCTYPLVPLFDSCRSFCLCIVIYHRVFCPRAGPRISGGVLRRPRASPIDGYGRLYNIQNSTLGSRKASPRRYQFSTRFRVIGRPKCRCIRVLERSGRHTNQLLAESSRSTTFLHNKSINLVAHQLQATNPGTKSLVRAQPMKTGHQRIMIPQRDGFPRQSNVLYWHNQFILPEECPA